MAFRHQTPFTVKTEVILEKLQHELQGKGIKGLDVDQRAVIYDVLQTFSRDLPGDSLAVAVPSSLPVNINSSILDIALWLGYKMCRGDGSCSAKKIAQVAEEAMVPQDVPQLIVATGPSKSAAEAHHPLSILAEEQPCCSTSLMTAQPAVKSVSAKKTDGMASNAESMKKIRRSKRVVKINSKYFNKDLFNPKTKGVVQIKGKENHRYFTGIPKTTNKYLAMKLTSSRSVKGGMIIPKNALIVNQGLCKIKLESDYVKIEQPDDATNTFDEN